MHKLKLDIFDNNPFNNPEYVKKRLEKDGIKIKPSRDIIDEEDYQEKILELFSEQDALEQFIAKNNLDVDVWTLSSTMRTF